MEKDLLLASTMASVAIVPFMYFIPHTAFLHCHFRTSY